MNQLEFQREMVAYDQKIALAKWEEAKAHENVQRLEHDKAMFNLNWITQVVAANNRAVEATPAEATKG